jgi:LuxR family maltose regulon positive regulatory protein
LAQADQSPSDLAKAYRWAETCGLDLEAHDRFSIEQLTLVRVSISRCSADLQTVHHFLSNQLQNATQKGLIGWAIEVLILQAQAYDAEGHLARAVTALEQALALAEPEGYVRIFLDEGARMAKLLEQVVARASPSSSYATRLLNAFKAEVFLVEPRHTSLLPAGKQAAFDQLRFSVPSLVESLSDREIEVLQLIAEGASNPEIASTLCITTNTVKKHVPNLFGKLNATSRTQAVRHGQALGLIH